MLDNLFSGDYSTLVGLLVAGFLVLIVVGTLLAIRSGRRRGDQVEVRPSDQAHRSAAMRTHLRAADQAHRDAQAAHQEAMRIAQTTSAPPPPPPPM
jgi:hypothetical protein